MLGISRVLINNCCRGKQESTMSGMRFEYVNPQDVARGVPGKNSMTKYERRRLVIELRKLIITLDKLFPGVLSIEDSKKISKLATCENRQYLLSLFSLFTYNISKASLEVCLNGIELSEQIRAIIRDL